AIGAPGLPRGSAPTEARLSAAGAADKSRAAATSGGRATCEGIHRAGVNAYMDKVVSTTVKGLTGLIKARGIEIVRGTGRLTGPTTVEVATAEGGVRTLEGGHIVLGDRKSVV